jgi:hypothetical protein
MPMSGGGNEGGESQIPMSGGGNEGDESPMPMHMHIPALIYQCTQTSAKKGPPPRHNNLFPRSFTRKIEEKATHRISRGCPLLLHQPTETRGLVHLQPLSDACLRRASLGAMVRLRRRQHPTVCLCKCDGKQGATGRKGNPVRGCQRERVASRRQHPTVCLCRCRSNGNPVRRCQRERVASIALRELGMISSTTVVCLLPLHKRQPHLHFCSRYLAMPRRCWGGDEDGRRNVQEFFNFSWWKREERGRRPSLSHPSIGRQSDHCQR